MIARGQGVGKHVLYAACSSMPFVTARQERRLAGSEAGDQPQLRGLCGQGRGQRVRGRGDEAVAQGQRSRLDGEPADLGPSAGLDGSPYLATIWPLILS